MKSNPLIVIALILFSSLAAPAELERKIRIQDYSAPDIIESESQKLQSNWGIPDEWQVTKTQWTAEDEIKFAEFISRLGYAVEKRQCASVQKCMRSSANPYAYTDSIYSSFYADCADLPYLLRSYFAWKNGLPMSVERSVAPRIVPGNNRDLRYTPFGNRVTSRYDPEFRYYNGMSILTYITNITSSASYRMIGLEDQGLYTDFYPVKIDRDSIHAGTVLYDPNGHVAMVYKVTDDGRIFYIDSHPDNSMTSGMFNRKFVRSYPHQGAGFKNFRPLSVLGAYRGYDGNIYAGKIVGARNSQLDSYSLEQFYGNVPDPGGDWQKGQFVFGGRSINFYDYVRVKMSDGILKIDPILDMRENVLDICGALKDRVQAVSIAIASGVQNQAHPYRLPYNIYGTTGDWENYSSPSRDARLKVSFMELISESRNIIQRYNSGDPAIDYKGKNLPGDLLKAYLDESRRCVFSYANSSRRIVTLNLEMLRQRLFDLSFDPYHCVELRWGASSAQELTTCPDGANKKAWYLQERWLRYQWERRYDVRMDYSLDELTGPKPGVGIAQPPDVDIIRFLNSQPLKEEFNNGPKD